MHFCNPFARAAAVLIFTLLLLLSPRAFSQLIRFNPATSVGFGASPWTPPAVLDPALTTTGLIRGSSIGTGGTPAGGCYGGAGGWSAGGGDPNCFYFTITAACHEISLSSFSGYTRKSGTGPSGCNIYYSLNGAPRVLVGSWTTTATSGTTGTFGSTSLTAITALQNIPPGTTVRIIINPTGSTTGNWYFTNTSLALAGTAVAVSAPTIAASPASSLIVTGAGTSFTVSGVTDAASYQWQRNTSGIGGGGTWVDITSATMDPTGTYAGYTTASTATSNTLTLSSVPASWDGYGYRCVVTNCAGSVTSTAALLNVSSASCSGTPSAGTAVPASTSFCNSGSTTVTLSGGSAGGGITYQWYSSATPSFGTAVPISGATLSTYTTTTLTDTTYFWCETTCGFSASTVTSAMGTVYVHPLPIIAVPSGNVCAGGSGAVLTASGADTYTWAPGTGLSATTGAMVTASPTSAMIYTVTGTSLATACSNTVTTTVSYNLSPGMLTVTPTSVTACSGDGAVAITSTGGIVGPTTVNSGTITIPSSIGAFGTISNAINVAGIPAGATIAGASVKIINFGSQYQDDYVINITAPNGNRLNLINQRGTHTSTTTTLFSNTELSSSAVTPVSSGSGVFTGSWLPDALIGVGGAPYTANVSAWSSLYSMPNGNWTLSIYNNSGFTNAVLTAAQWSITLEYSYQAPVIWSPLTNLYTDAAATIPYTGTAATTIYFDPSVVGTGTLTATADNGGCTVDASVTTSVNALPAAFSGTQTVCEGSTTTLSSSFAGGTWSGTTAVANVNSTTGDVTGLVAGTVVVTYTAPGGCYRTTIVTVNAMPGAISGPAAVCESASVSLSNSIGGGTWSASNGNASVDASGVVTGSTTGSVNVSYTLPGGCYEVKFMTVNQIPASFSGTLQVCEGATTVLSNVVPGGTWASGSTTTATVGLLSGAANGVSAGFADITYTLGTGCYRTAQLTVNALPSPITGATVLCELANGTEASLPAGGTWSSGSGNVIANISTGAISAVSAGTANVSYTLPTGCYRCTTVTVNALPAPIGGAPQVCIGSSAIVTDATSGGTWSSGGPGIIIGPTTGSMYGAALGITPITYTLGSTGCYVTRSIAVNDLPSAITGSLGVCVGYTTNLSSIPSGGTWATGNANASAAPGGVISGLSVGTSNVTYTLPTGCIATTTVTVNSLPASIAGSNQVCIAATQNLSNATPGGTWSSSNSSRISANTITGDVTGMSTGAATITYHLGSGCHVTFDMTVNPNPPAISGGTSFCSGTSVTMSNSLAGGTWSTSNPLIATADMTSGVVTGVNGGIVYVSYTIPTGCYSVKFLSVNPTPAAITGIGNLCTGKTHVYYSGTPGGLWTSSNTLIATATATSGVVTGVHAGTVTLSYILPTGCAIDRVITIDASPSVITGGDALCPGSAFTFANDTPGGVWASDNLMSLPLSSTGYVVAGTPGTAAITYTLPNGCLSSKVVTVNAVPLAFAVTGGGSYCSGGSGVFVGVLGSQTGVVYNLYNGTAMAASAPGTGASISYGSLAAGVYTVQAKVSTTGCTSDMSGSAVVTVLPAVVPLVAISGGTPTSVCEGSVVSYSATPTNGGTAPAYLWTVNGVFSGIGDVYSYMPSAGDVVMVKMTSNAACRVFDLATATDTADVVPSVVPAVYTIVMPNDTVCPHTAVTFYASGVAGGSAPSYSWMVNGMPAGFGTTFTTMPADGDNVVCVMTSNATCRTADTDNSDAIEVSVKAELHPLVSVAATPGAIVNRGTTVTFTATAAGAGSMPKYQWFRNNSPISGATQTIYTTSLLDDRDSISCLVTGTTECAAYSGSGAKSMTIISPNSVGKQTSVNSGMLVMPNPNNGTFVVSAPGISGAKIVVADAFGRQVYTRSADGAKEDEVTIALDGTIPAGIYILTAIGEALNATKKVTVTR